MNTNAHFQLLSYTVNVQRALSFHSLSKEAAGGVWTLPNAAFDRKGALTKKPQLISPYYA